jgi:hypothetical protein
LLCVLLVSDIVQECAKEDEFWRQIRVWAKEFLSVKDDAGITEDTLEIDEPVSGSDTKKEPAKRGARRCDEPRCVSYHESHYTYP